MVLVYWPKLGQFHHRCQLNYHCVVQVYHCLSFPHALVSPTAKGSHEGKRQSRENTASDVQNNLLATSVCIPASCCKTAAVNSSRSWFSSDAPTLPAVHSTVNTSISPESPECEVVSWGFLPSRLGLCWRELVTAGVLETASQSLLVPGLQLGWLLSILWWYHHPPGPVPTGCSQ